MGVSEKLADVCDRYWAFQCAETSAPSRESKFFGPFLRAGAAYQDLAAEAENVIANDVVPAWLAYVDFIANDLARSARDSIACTGHLDGDRLYAVMIKSNTTVDQSPRAAPSLAADRE